MKPALMNAVVVAIVIVAAGVVAFAANDMEPEQRREARKRLREIRRAWDDADRAMKLTYLRELARYPDRSVGRFLDDVMTEPDVHDDVASQAAWALGRHGDPDDFDVLDKAYTRAGTAERRAAIARWMGMFGEEAALDDLRRIAVGDDASARAAVLALRDLDSEPARDAVAVCARAGKYSDASRLATRLLLGWGDERGLEGLESAGDLADAALAAHAAIGTELETSALRIVLNHARKAPAPADDKRPHEFASLLARLADVESHRAVLEAAGGLQGKYDVELGWWLTSVNRAGIGFDAAASWLEGDEVLRGLRCLQRLPAPLSGDALQSAGEAIQPLIESEDDNVAAHAMFTAVSTGACEDALAEKIAAWIDDEDPFRRAAAMLAAGRKGLSEHADRALELLDDEHWYVQSAALDALLRLRPAGCAARLLEFARAQRQGRLYSEALVLLADLAGVDHGDDFRKWTEWLAENEEFTPADRKLDSLRGVPHTVTRDRSAATFYGLEISSDNVQFALDRSVSMVNAVSREPERPGFAQRKEDILRRRPEVRRMMRDGFLPRFYVAAAELHSALDGMEQDARFGITLFNHETIHHERTTNGFDNRRDALNWMLSTNIQGGTDIEAALLEIIKAGEADTILLLSDGEPLSLGILERIARANAVMRVNISVVSIHEHAGNRHYLNAIATRHHGTITDAEPNE